MKDIELKEFIELAEGALLQLKKFGQEQLMLEPNHPRNKFDYTVIVPDHPLGYHEHYTNDLQVAKKSAIEWATEYGKASANFPYNFGLLLKILSIAAT